MDHEGTFSSLKSLLGVWSGETEAGRLVQVSYTLHAKESVLLEHWQLTETTDALTIYHLDSDVLMATHYCPLCNQPRLNLMHENLGQIGFEFVSATNLPDQENTHQHSFQIQLIDANTFWRSETYVGVGGFTEGVIYKRL